MFVCVTAIAVTSISLQVINSRLKNQLKAATEVELGEIMADLEGIDVRGQRVKVDLTTGGTKSALILVYSKCATADAVLKAWRELASKVPGQVVVLNFSGSAEVEDLFPPGTATLVALDPATVCKYKFRTFPQTILVNRRGEVVRVVTGRLGAREVGELTRLSHS